MAATDEKYGPKMSARFAGQLTTILSFSRQGDTTERIRVWEREIATYERDSGKVLDAEIKNGMFLLRLTESQLKTHLLVRVDSLKMDRFQVVAISRAISTAQTQATPMDVGAMSKGTPSKSGKGAKVGGQRNNQSQQACPGCSNTGLTSANCPHSDKTCRKCEEVGHLTSACRSSGIPQPKAKGGGKKGKGGKGAAGTAKTCWNCGENGHLSSQCSKHRSTLSMRVNNG